MKYHFKPLPSPLLRVALRVYAQLRNIEREIMNKGTNIGCGVVITLFLIVVAIICVLTSWADRTLDFWCTYWAHHTVNVPIWLSFLATIIGNAIMFILNIISEIARLVMGI